VFKISTRYKRDILNTSFKSWLRGFSSWCLSDGVDLDTDAALIDAIDRYTVYWSSMGLRDRAFLKAAAFRMLKNQCEVGNERLIRLFKDVVIGF